jgi:hypothetical protein
MQHAPCGASRDPSIAEAQRAELRARHNAVLGGGKPRDRLVQRG